MTLGSRRIGCGHAATGWDRPRCRSVSHGPVRHGTDGALTTCSSKVCGTKAWARRHETRPIAAVVAGWPSRRAREPPQFFPGLLRSYEEWLQVRIGQRHALPGEFATVANLRGKLAPAPWLLFA